MELNNNPLSVGRSIAILLPVFAAGYLLSSLLRGITAALAPIFTQQFSITPAELGLLAGAYFASFAVLQLPMGAWLDRYGVRTVLVASLTVAAVSCALFAAATSYSALFWARLLSGVGVSACLIAPLTAVRLWTTPIQQQRINSWMLMAGALGLILGTLPAESLATNIGWRPLFIGLGVLFALVSVLIAVTVPKQQKGTGIRNNLIISYIPIVRNSYTWKIGPMGLFNYAILVAVQTLWVGPWLTNLGGVSTRDASTQLLYINTIMLVMFMVMGYLSPKFNKSADDAERLLIYWTPISIILLILIAYLGSNATWHLFSLYCISAWPLSVTHPLVGQRFKPREAGRAIAFFNLLLFTGVFLWQWGFGLIISTFKSSVGITLAYQLAVGLLAFFSFIGYMIFMITNNKKYDS